MSIVCEAHGIEEHDCGSPGLTIGLYRNSKGLCAKCGLRPPTQRFGGDGIHAYMSVGCCAICVFTAQLEHAQERAAAIPELEERLTRLEADQPPAPKGDTP